MANLYIITGPAGVGKTTISKRISENKAKSVLIEGDDIYAQVIGSYVSAWKEGNHLDVFWDVCISSIVTPNSLERIKNEFKNYKIKFVVLMTNEQDLLSRDKARPEDCQMKERCITLLNDFKNYNYNNENILDTSDLTVDETFDIIENDDRFVL